MKRLCIALAGLSLAVSLAATPSTTPLTNVQMDGANNWVKSGATFTIKSGGTFTVEGGGLITGVYTTDTELTALKNLTATANYVPMWDSSSTAVNLSVTAVSQALLAQTTANAWRNAIFPATAAEGDLTTFDGTNWIRVPIGTTGQILTAQGDGTFAWSDFSVSPDAVDVAYDNTTSGLTATDVQAAIDEISAASVTLTDTQTLTNKTLTSPIFSTDFTLANSAAPTTATVAQTAFDTNAWATSHGAIQVNDGTANTFVVATQASDMPTNGQVPTWNTGGTITWETAAGGGAALYVGRVTKTSTYTVVAGDKGYLIDCTSGTFTVNLTAAATLGSGFFVAIYNSGTGVITIDADNTEVIRILGTTTQSFDIPQGDGAILFCNGTGWYLQARPGLGGTTGTTNRALLTADGTGGGTVRASAITLSSNSADMTWSTAANLISGGNFEIRGANNATVKLTTDNNSGTFLTPLGGQFTSTASSSSTSSGAVIISGGLGVAERTSTASLNVGASNGTTIDLIASATATLDFPSIAANGGTQDLTITVTGAAVGDAVFIGLPAAPNAGVVFNGWVSATNTATIRATNATTGAIDPASATYRATVVSF